MAYMNQERKAQISAALKPVLAKYGMKGTLSVNNHTAITLTLTQGPINFGGDRKQINQFWIADHYQGIAKDFLLEAYEAMKAAQWFDESDSQTDYFHTAYYINMNVGRWDKPYRLAV